MECKICSWFSRLKDAKEIANELKLCVKVVYKMRKEGMPAFRIGSSYRYDLHEVQQYIIDLRDKSK